MSKSWQRWRTRLPSLLEGSLVQQQVDALAGGELAFGVLAGGSFGAATGLGGGVTAAHFLPTAA